LRGGVCSPMDIDAQARYAEQALAALQEAAQGGGKKATASEQQQRLKDCERAALRAKNAMESYKLELRSLPEEQQVAQQHRLQTLENGLKQAKAQMQWRRFDAEAAAAAASPGQASAEGPMTCEQALATADKIQDASQASVARSMGMVLQSEEVAIATLGRMHEQEEQMARIGHEMEDVKANIQRSKKLVTQIARNAARDRCNQGLCVLIAVAVMIMLTLAITGKDGKRLNVPDAVRQG